MKDMFEDFCWHSSIGIDDSLNDNKRFVTRVANTPRYRDQFIVAGENLLIHKVTQALWRINDDQKTIEPVFGSDIISQEDLDTMGDE